MANLIITETQELKNLIKSAIKEIEEEKQSKLKGINLYTINQVAKRLGKAHLTIKKLVQAGYIRTTASGLITEEAINDYLKKS
jgi:hypothetical protein